MMSSTYIRNSYSSPALYQPGPSTNKRIDLLDYGAMHSDISYTESCDSKYESDVDKFVGNYNKKINESLNFLNGQIGTSLDEFSEESKSNVFRSVSIFLENVRLKSSKKELIDTIKSEHQRYEENIRDIDNSEESKIELDRQKIDLIICIYKNINGKIKEIENKYKESPSVAETISSILDAISACLGGVIVYATKTGAISIAPIVMNLFVTLICLTFFIKISLYFMQCFSGRESQQNKPNGWLLNIRKYMPDNAEKDSAQRLIKELDKKQKFRKEERLRDGLTQSLCDVVRETASSSRPPSRSNSPVLRRGRGYQYSPKPAGGRRNSSASLGLSKKTQLRSGDETPISPVPVDVSWANLDAALTKRRPSFRRSDLANLGESSEQHTS